VSLWQEPCNMNNVATSGHSFSAFHLSTSSSGLLCCTEKGVLIRGPLVLVLLFGLRHGVPPTDQ
jgi:hypothetical protein